MCDNKKKVLNTLQKYFWNEKVLKKVQKYSIFLTLFYTTVEWIYLLSDKGKCNDCLAQFNVAKKKFFFCYRLNKNKQKKKRNTFKH